MSKSRTFTGPGYSKNIFRAALLASAVVLGGCTDPLVQDELGRFGPRVGDAELPSVVQRLALVDDVLLCIADTHVLEDVVFLIGSFADSTGKINATAQGGTGNFLPQGGSASYLTDAIRRAGGQAVSTYFGTPSQPVAAQYALNGIFNSLDFGRRADIDVRAGGVGPVIATGWAQLSLTIQLDEASTRLNRQLSMIQRPIRYQQYGFGLGRDFNGTLVTGAGGVQGQERLQLEALNGPIALGVAAVLMEEFPRAESECGHLIAPLLEDRPVEGEDAVSPENVN